MAYLLLNKTEQTVRRISNSEFAYDWDTFTGWEQAEIEGDKDTLLSGVEPTIEPVDGTEDFKWYSATDECWYKVNTVPKPMYRYASGEIICRLSDYDNNSSEVI